MKNRLLSGRALWGLLWRSTLFLPFAMALSIAWLGRFFLPLVGILFFGCGEWTYGIVAFVAWASNATMP